MASDSNADQVLQALQKEATKAFRVYDGSDRLITSYEAVQNAVHGQSCLKTEYTYIGATTKLEKLKETIATWDSSYDI